MSAHLAIPATTHVLRAILESQLEAAYGDLTAPAVSIGSPPRPPTAGNAAPAAEAPGLILFMHHAAPNPAWRNMYDPVMDSNGIRIARSPLVLDLHYLLAAQGGDLEREVVLGVGMTAFHRNGIIPRDRIKQILTALVIDPDPTNIMQTLGGAKLNDKDVQPESITISQQALDVDLSTKLWSAFQSPLRPSAFYLVTTVFLEVDEEIPPTADVEKIAVASRPSSDPRASDADDAVIMQTDPLP
jgi:hypothetical protein